eukprot:1428586-Rhodomonas_salina.1
MTPMDVAITINHHHTAVSLSSRERDSVCDWSFELRFNSTWVVMLVQILQNRTMSGRALRLYGAKTGTVNEFPVQIPPGFFLLALLVPPLQY